MQSKESSTPRPKPLFEVVTLVDYLKGRDLTHRADYTDEILENSIELLNRVNGLLIAINCQIVRVSSGWRPPELNEQVGGKPKSYHMLGKAIDIFDNDRWLATKLREKPELLKDFELWLEDPESTPGWIHLDTGKRTEREIRIFKP